ncbi:quinone-dependent dihydroorotate dehydrogenase [Saxibacter everestensis]|uniref:Dihydroorotate dehydrogenase (quinone) n=1 Tax=Saxibacter everestensis TaxID=2909229 RepID=A0ABY8QYP0_9MICO|nr:quinone-dependent dihydroorotate dehydrogenase [Brevibacteriaceae bacterium ZFBP1038]
MDAELAHSIGFAAIRILNRMPVTSKLVRRFCYPKRHHRVRALGLDFPSAFGLAAGFDKNAVGVCALGNLGFGAIEVGTVTGQPQPGNPKPRLFRLVADHAVINRMGFNNAGAEAVAANISAAREQLEHVPRGIRPVIGVNIGKTKAVPIENAVDDYVRSTELLAPLADYLVINVSSPNTPGLRDLQTVEALRPLIRAVREAADRVVTNPASSLGHVPLLVKIAPDLADADLLAIADLATELKLDGLIATNTTISRDGLRSAPALIEKAGAGGLSGAPVRQRALEVLKLLKDRAGDDMTLVAVGGITTAQDAIERLDAGADLVQGYTAFLYQGPFWANRVTSGLAASALES